MLSNKQVLLTDVQLKSNAPYFATRAVSGKYQKRYIGVQYYELKFTANYQPETITLVKQFIAKHQLGRAFEFNISYAGRYTGTAQGNIMIASQVQPGGRILKLSQFSGTLEAGTLVQFQNHSKLYTVTEDVKAGGDLKLFPALMGTVQAGEELKYRDPKGQFVLTNDTFDLNLQSLSKIDFSATEKI